MVSNRGDEELPASQQALLRAIELACAADAAEGDWRAVLDAAREHSVLDERLEILLVAIRSARRVGRSDKANAYLAEARECAAEAPWWAERLRAL